MTQEEIIQAISDDKMMPFIQPDQLANIVDFVMKNSQPSLLSNLDEAAEEYLDGIFGKGKHQNFYVELFKAGAEWIALQSTRTRLAVKSNTPEGKDAYEKVAKEMRALVAAKNYWEDIYCPILKHKNKTGLNCTAVEDAFLKGAEWMAGRDKEKIEQAFFSGYNECEDRMKKEFERRAMAGEVNNTGYPTTIQLHTFDSSLKNGDKVNIIIIKQEQD